MTDREVTAAARMLNILKPLTPKEREAAIACLCKIWLQERIDTEEREAAATTVPTTPG